MTHPFDPLIRRQALSPLDAEALRGLRIQKKALAAGTTIASQGESLDHSIVVLDGLLGRSKTTDGGQQQIVSIYVTGDIPDLSALFLPTVDADLAAIGATTVGFIHRESLIELMSSRIGIVAALWREMSIDASITREWLLNIGQRNSEQRLAHFLLEMSDRLTFARPDDASQTLPLTQMQIASVLGISDIHVNRVLQDLRSRGFVRLSRRTLEIGDRRAIAAFCGYDPTYLHQHDQQAKEARASPPANELGGGV